jgi:hypothetical protein
LRKANRLGSTESDLLIDSCRIGSEVDSAKEGGNGNGLIPSNMLYYYGLMVVVSGLLLVGCPFCECSGRINVFDLIVGLVRRNSETSSGCAISQSWVEVAPITWVAL